MKIVFTDEEREGKVIGGVDTHTDTHWLCVLGERGDVRLSQEFPATAAGYDELARAIGPSDGCLAVGVEGTGSFGAGPTRRLSELGYRVYEVLRPKREKRGIAEDKNDGADAERAARDVMAGHGLSEPKSQDGWVEGVRVLLNARDQAVKACTSLAALCGVSPVEASSGKTKRHRLKRGGDRRANTALYMICIRRMGHDPRTRAYVARYGGYGGPGNNKEIECRLKRYIAREAYHAIMHPFDLRDYIDGRELAKIRKQAGLRQIDVAAALGVSTSSISDVENMREPRRELAKKYAAWIEQGMPIDAD